MISVFLYALKIFLFILIHTSKEEILLCGKLHYFYLFQIGLQWLHLRSSSRICSVLCHVVYLHLSNISFGCIEGSVPDRFASSPITSYTWRDFLVHDPPILLSVTWDLIVIPTTGSQNSFSNFDILRNLTCKTAYIFFLQISYIYRFY